MEAGGSRRGRGQRLLYWFRTPPGVRVGRAPIDEEAMRLLEQSNPGVDFDWPRLLKEPAADAQPRRERERDGRDGRDRREPRREARPPQRTRPMETSAAAVPPLRPEIAIEMQEQAEAADVRSSQHADSIAADVTDDFDAAATAHVHGEDIDAADEPLEPASPAAARLGVEGLRQLRARYLDIVARLEEKPMEDPVRTELKASVERLNPDGWRTAEEVESALEQYEAIFESVRSVVGRQPRRRV